MATIRPQMSQPIPSSGMLIAANKLRISEIQYRQAKQPSQQIALLTQQLNLIQTLQGRLYQKSRRIQGIASSMISTWAPKIREIKKSVKQSKKDKKRAPNVVPLSQSLETARKLLDNAITLKHQARDTARGRAFRKKVL